MVRFTDNVVVEGTITATEQGLETGSAVILDETGHIQEILLPMTYTQTVLEPSGWTLTGVNYYQDVTVPGISQLIYPTISDMASSDAQRDAVANGNIYVQSITKDTEVVRFLSQQYKPMVSINVHVRGMKGDLVANEFVSEFGHYRRAFVLADSTIPPTAGAVLTGINDSATALQTQINDKLGLHATADRAIADADGVAITTYQKMSQKGVINGYASLDASVKIPIAQIPTGNAAETVLKLSSAVASGQYVAFDGTGFRGATLGNVLTYKGTVSSFSDLPANASTGDVWNVTNAHGTYPAGTNFAWDGTQWDGLGGTVDLSPYQTKSNLVTAFQPVPDNTHYVSEKLVWDRLATKEDVANKTASFQSVPTDTRYPSEKLVKDSLDTKQNNLIYDSVPTGASLNMVRSGAIKSALDTKVDKNASIVAGTNTKITYDSKGLVTAGESLVAGDIPDLAYLKLAQGSGNANKAVLTDASGNVIVGTPPATVVPTLNGEQNNTPSWYAPTVAGASGQVLQSTGNTPSWTTLGTASSRNTGIAEGNVPLIGADGKLHESLVPGSVKFYVNVTITASAGTPPLSGITVTATPTSGVVLSAITGADGKCTLTGAVQGATYTIVPTKEYYVFTTIPNLTVQDITSSVTCTGYETPRVNVTCTGVPIAGRTITAEASGFANVTGITDSTGACQMRLPVATWFMRSNTASGYYAPDPRTLTTQAGQTHSVTFLLQAMPILNITVTPSSLGAGLLVTSVSSQTYTGYTNASGTLALTVCSGTHAVSVTPPAGYLVPATQTVVTLPDGTYALTFEIQTKPIVNVTVTDSSGGGNQSGRTITATNGTDTVTGTTNASGVVNLTLNGTGAYTISTNLPSGATADPVSITAAAGGSYTATLTLNFGFKFSMTFNATTFKTDPTGCLVYGDDASGMTPASNTNTSLGTISSPGSWVKSTNKLLKKLYYATFNTDGSISKILNPDNLALDEDGNASDIATKNTMLVIPTLYTRGEVGKLTISDKSAEGTAYAHTIGGHVYDYLAIGVYNGYVSGGKLMSLSGVLPTKSQNRANFRTQANANGTNWMLWNYYQWKLMKELTFFTLKSFDGQRKLGQGGHAYGSNTTGVTNAMGPFAGDVSGTSSAMKFLLEDWWGSQYNFIDDFFGTGGTYYAGQNAIPTDNASNKVQVFNNLTSGWWYGTTINQNDLAFGIASAAGGDNAKGLCDGQYGSTSSNLLGFVGGSSVGASDGYAGPSCLDASDALSISSTIFGARLAFVFDD